MGKVAQLTINVLIVWLTVWFIAPTTFAQEATQASPSNQQVTPQSETVRRIARLESLSTRIAALRAERAEFLADNSGAASALSEANRLQLRVLDTELAQLSETFDIVDTIKNVTEKPRQIAILRDAAERNRRQIGIAEQAINTLERQSALSVTATTKAELESVLSDWFSTKQNLEDKLVTNEAKLLQLQQNEVPLSDKLRGGLRSFVLGRGLTLLLAIAAACLAWILMRGVWWLAINKFMSKNTRRKAVWFRLMSYSFALLTGVVMFVAVIAVLQIRQDTLLLAIALVLTVTAVLSLRNYLPNFINETRLLLNLGPVREDERLMLNGIPWNVENINLQTVLRNPALHGVVRLPIADVKNLTSRPYRDDLWFPSNTGDYVLLPGDVFGFVLQQTPELIQVRVLGGMIKSIPTAEYFAQPIINLSRGETFGVMATFGLDYAVQHESLTTIPDTLRVAIQNAITNAGHPAVAENILVELSEAGASSLDYLIYAQFPSTHASDYFKFGRIIRQACVQACNENNWSIPYPQMVMHRATD